MHKVYEYIDSYGIPEGAVEIEGINYKFSRIENLRYSERPDYKGWTIPSFGTWIICPEKGVYVKVELMPKH